MKIFPKLPSATTAAPVAAAALKLLSAAIPEQNWPTFVMKGGTTFNNCWLELTYIAVVSAWQLSITAAQLQTTAAQLPTTAAQLLTTALKNLTTAGQLLILAPQLITFAKLELT